MTVLSMCSGGPTGGMAAAPPRRGAAGLAAACILTLALGGCATGEAANAKPPAGVAAVVDATTLLNFSPRVVRIKVGDTVEWRNGSPFGHTVTDDPRLTRSPTNARLPKGAKAFNGALPPGGTFRHRFTRAGAYAYFCIPHEGQGMTGTVVVTAR